MIWTGLPVVSCPYMPAAEMPMPCCPRLMRSRWNLDPYRSFAKIGGICWRMMPGPLSVTVIRKRLAWLAGGAASGLRSPTTEAARLARRGRSLPIGDGLHLDDHVGEDPGFLAGVKRVIDGLLHTGEQRLSRIVEPQQMPVLGEELGDGDLPLARPHLDGGHRRLRLRGDRTGLRRMELPAARWHGLCSTIPHIPFIQAESATGSQVFPLTAW